MQHRERREDARRYEARLLDGPLAGVSVAIPSLPGGEPRDVIRIDGETRGAYVLAGFESLRGYTPYRWVTPKGWASLQQWLRPGKTEATTPDTRHTPPA